MPPGDRLLEFVLTALVLIAVPGGGEARVPWAIAFGGSDVDLIGSATLSAKSFGHSDTKPALLALDAGRVLEVTGRPEIRPVRQLDVVLYRADGSRVGLLAREFLHLALDFFRRHLMPIFGEILLLPVQLVLTFPEGRPWSRLARIGVLAAYTLTLGGQLVGGLVVPDTRDLLSVTSHPSVAAAIDRAQAIAGVGVALGVLFLILQRVHALGRPARRAQAPLLLAAAITALAGLVWLGWVTATDARVPTLETIARALAMAIPVGIVVGIGWSRLRPQFFSWAFDFTPNS